jgi:hypothetical protein
MNAAIPTLTSFELLLDPLLEHVVVMRYCVATVWLTVTVAVVAPAMLFHVPPPSVERRHW